MPAVTATTKPGLRAITFQAARASRRNGVRIAATFGLHHGIDHGIAGAALWLLACGGALVALLAALRRLGQGFALTRHVLQQDWQNLKEPL